MAVLLIRMVQLGLLWVLRGGAARSSSKETSGIIKAT
jgi:hypothetical protein